MSPDRRTFLKGSSQGLGLALLSHYAGWAGAVLGVTPSGEALAAERGGDAEKISDPVRLPRLLEDTERESSDMPSQLPPARRIGYAIVGLGRLSLEEILPAFAQSKRARPVALVSGDATKARHVAEQYGIPRSGLFSYASFDEIRNHPEIDAVYVVLPNSLHEEFTVRAAAAGKHVLCEKPMATRPDECERMIAACRAAGRKLMIAYRCQYEPHHRYLRGLIEDGRTLGKVRMVQAHNAQNQSSRNTSQWRLHRKLAGGGSLPDIGLYCLNSARFLTGEEPYEVSAITQSSSRDPRFAEVEDIVSFQLRFPGDLIASLGAAYSAHESRFLTVLGDRGHARMDPAFSYKGIRLATSALRAGDRGGPAEGAIDLRIEEKNQFALELDHFAECIAANREPFTPGEEGLQDHRIMAAIYESAAGGGKPVALRQILSRDAFRGPAPREQAA